jgi:hypothetical protein
MDDHPYLASSVDVEEAMEALVDLPAHRGTTVMVVDMEGRWAPPTPRCSPQESPR